MANKGRKKDTLDSTRKSDSLGFETARELRAIFNDEFEKWRRARGGRDLETLARLVGVSQAYLSQVRRYGRIPGRPVLFLLSLNFGLQNPNSLLRAARIDDEWPYEEGIGLHMPASDDGVFSVRFNMDAFTEAIRTVVRAESRGRSFKEVLGGRPIRIGLNLTQHWMFGRTSSGSIDTSGGVFPELCRMLGIALHREVVTQVVPFAEYADALSQGTLDLYGPLMAAPQDRLGVLFTRPLYRIGVSVLFRKRSTHGLEPAKAPRSLADLSDQRYQIGVLKNSLPHLLANTRLNRSDSELVICNSDEEAFDRLMLKGVRRPIHAYICNSVMAREVAHAHPGEIQLLFATPNTFIDTADNAIAVRQDLPDFVESLNNSLEFVMSRGGFQERMESSLQSIRQSIEHF